MYESAPTLPAANPLPDSAPSTADLAVSRCDKAYKRAEKAAISKGKGRISAQLRAKDAYRNAMPFLAGDENIRDFIACTAHGILLGIIPCPDGAKLLYAARVAHMTCRGQPKLSKPALKPTPPGGRSPSLPCFSSMKGSSADPVAHLKNDATTT